MLSQATFADEPWQSKGQIQLVRNNRMADYPEVQMLTAETARLLEGSAGSHDHTTVFEAPTEATRPIKPAEEEDLLVAVLEGMIRVSSEDGKVATVYNKGAVAKIGSVGQACTIKSLKKSTQWAEMRRTVGMTQKECKFKEDCQYKVCAYAHGQMQQDLLC
jgi:hypothetical protein